MRIFLQGHFVIRSLDESFSGTRAVCPELTSSNMFMEPLSPKRLAGQDLQENPGASGTHLTTRGGERRGERGRQKRRRGVRRRQERRRGVRRRKRGDRRGGDWRGERRRRQKRKRWERRKEEETDRGE